MATINIRYAFWSVGIAFGRINAEFKSNYSTIQSITISTNQSEPTDIFFTTFKLTADADTELYQYNLEKNLGKKRQLNVISRADWNARILVRFDLSTLPTDAVVQSCQLNMFMSEASNFGSREHGAFGLTNHSNDWGEGNHLFSTSSPGDSSWNWFSRSQEWTEIGGDIADQPTAIVKTGTANQVWNIWDLTSDCVKKGKLSWILKDMNEDNPSYTMRTEYQSRESYYENQQPYLKVVFSTNTFYIPRSN